MSLGKKLSITTLATICFICFGIIGWYIYVLAFAPTKVISQSYEVGVQRVVDKNGNTSAKNFIEVNIYKDVFEIKFNYMLDETKTAFYSQGVQYVLKDDAKEFNFDGSYKTKLASKKIIDTRRIDIEPFISTYQTDFNNVYTDIEFKNIEKFNYMSGDDYENTLLSTDPIDLDTMFKIELGDEIYGMKFKGAEANGQEDFKINTETHFVDSTGYGFWTRYDYHKYNNFKASDVDLFASIVFDACKPVVSGTQESLVFEFGDLFNYYEYDAENKQYNDHTVETDIYAKIIANVKSYYCISVNKFDVNMDSSSDSIFNCYKGSSNWNLETAVDDYFLGRTLAYASIKEFEFIETAESMVYDFKLRDEFIDYYADFTKTELYVVIDLDQLKELGITFNGFVDGTFDEFNHIYKVVTIETIDGVLVEKGVAYA